MRINRLAFALTGGIMWGLIMAIMTTTSLFFDYGTLFMNAIGSIYYGYTISYIGIAVGAIYGFLDGFIGLFIFAAIYNKIYTKMIE